MKNDIPWEAALELLKAGNKRYVEDQARRPRSTPRRRAETSGGQWPFAVVLTCADSRVSPELLFDQGIGDVFVARVAGNVASSEVIGSIQYAVQYLHTSLVVVLGHEGCGAVKGALEAPPNPPKELVALVGVIKKAIGNTAKLGPAVEKNAKHAKKQLAAALKGSEMKHSKVVAATYGLSSGAVTWLP